MDEERAAYDEVYVYAMGRPGFLLQHVVDAFAVQRATSGSKMIGVVFGLVGLYLYVEKEYSGRQIQRVHLKLASRKREWRPMNLPDNRGEITVLDVLKAPAGSPRDAAIACWCRCVWASFSDNRSSIVSILQEFEIIGPSLQ